ncbi:mCG144987, partial [Mus musculus]
RFSYSNAKICCLIPRLTCIPNVHTLLYSYSNLYLYFINVFSLFIIKFTPEA